MFLFLVLSLLSIFQIFGNQIRGIIGVKSKQNSGEESIYPHISTPPQNHKSLNLNSHKINMNETNILETIDPSTLGEF